MPTYYFEVIDDRQLLIDEGGVICNDLSHPKRHAQSLIPDIACERLPKEDRRDLSVIVRSNEGRRCYTATLTLRGETVADGPVLRLA